ncbi:toxin [Streptosporangium violaceochromogenes]|nr:toxin [Streptosporangium violaceochromogenes]
MDVSRIMWRKSSRSGNGRNCVEVGVWRKSSLSGNGSNCAEVATLGNAQGGADVDRLFLVRDSKDPDDPVLSFGPSAWDDFLEAVKSGGPDGLTTRPEV